MLVDGALLRRGAAEHRRRSARAPVYLGEAGWLTCSPSTGVSAGYGRAVVLSDVAFRLGEGEALAVLGRNGVGKTTLIDSVVGVTRRFAGSLCLGGREIATLAPEARAAAGIGWVPQERNIFRSLTVRGEHHRRRASWPVEPRARLRPVPAA